MLDFDRLRLAPVTHEPFPFVIVPHLLAGDAIPSIERDFPAIHRYGSFPLVSLNFGPAFRTLIDGLTSTQMKEILEHKLGIDLAGRPVMATVRGMCTARDGQIHTDSVSKLVTLLFYINRSWECASARLRLLRSPESLDDVVAEVPAEEATLVAFRNGPNAWHGFAPFHGQRRVIQVNWVKDESVVNREQSRHRVSAFLKRFFLPAKTNAA